MLGNGLLMESLAHRLTVPVPPGQYIGSSQCAACHDRADKKQRVPAGAQAAAARSIAGAAVRPYESGSSMAACGPETPRRARAGASRSRSSTHPTGAARGSGPEPEVGQRRGRVAGIPHQDGGGRVHRENQPRVVTGEHTSSIKGQIFFLF
jgi:hypothetical protein